MIGFWLVKISKLKLFFVAVDVDVDFIISFSSSPIIEENEDDEEGGKVFVSFSAQSEEGYLICGRLNQRRIRENRERKRYFRTTLSFIVYVVWYTYDILLTSCDSQLILFLGSVVSCPSIQPTNSSSLSQNWTCITKTMFFFVFLELEDDILCKIFCQTCFSPPFRKQVLAIRVFLSSSILWKVRVDASQGHILVNIKHQI